ncbi:MAG: hypothetical protein IKX14_00555 [Neisseriaceae bacterium]|nr:hypothetical protein [Neisseriaceae bacterium]
MRFSQNNKRPQPVGVFFGVFRQPESTSRAGGMRHCEPLQSNSVAIHLKTVSVFKQRRKAL